MKHILTALFLTMPLGAWADAPVIEDVKAIQKGSTWTFSVTLRHGDTGWDDYADGWEILGPDGARLGFRELLHPHVNEQPFTRSLSGVEIPADMNVVYIRARDNVGGWSEEKMMFELPKR